MINVRHRRHGSLLPKISTQRSPDLPKASTPQDKQNHRYSRVDITFHNPTHRHRQTLKHRNSLDTPTFTHKNIAELPVHNTPIYSPYKLASLRYIPIDEDEEIFMKRHHQGIPLKKLHSRMVEHTQKLQSSKRDQGPNPRNSSRSPLPLPASRSPLQQGQELSGWGHPQPCWQLSSVMDIS